MLFLCFYLILSTSLFAGWEIFFDSYINISNASYNPITKNLNISLMWVGWGEEELGDYGRNVLMYPYDVFLDIYDNETLINSIPVLDYSMVYTGHSGSYYGTGTGHSNIKARVYNINTKLPLGADISVKFKIHHFLKEPLYVVVISRVFY